MNSKSWVTKNMVLGFEFDKYLVEHPSFAKRIPHGATLIFLPESDRELCKKNLSLSEKEKRSGKNVVLVKIKRLAPLPKSRIQHPILALSAA